VSALAFELPAHLEAHEPPEARGLSRDQVRLMVARRSSGTLVHTRFDELPEFLDPGDLLVLNTSATFPAALPARRVDGQELELRLSTPSPSDPAEDWVVELRLGEQPFGDAQPGEELALPDGAQARILARYASSTRLWLARLELPAPLGRYLELHGRPIRYRYVPRPWPLEAYQTAYALDPGSAEMPSAGRPLSSGLITRLAASGVLIAPVTLHTGVSSPERHEPPYPERYRVPPETARLVDAAHGWGGKVVAVGTTVVRALESVAGRDRRVRPGAGWTNLVVSPERGLRAVDGLLTGWHEPGASHLQLLRAAAGEELLSRSYRAAIAHGYLWHEFGDSHLILP
jgi:S-adenosylmethionine:tRNA ribosyltransferase-isomerase